MSQRPLPQGGPDRQIFVVGLRRMSAQCDVPDLTPECPFYEITSQGPLCGEQCMDLLAETGNGEPSPAEQPLGLGLAAIQRPAPRPRRSPEADARAFDATEILIRDRDRPIEQKTTTFLIKDLRDLLTTPPAYMTDAHERSYRLHASRDELVRRGVDADLIIRCGLAPRVSVSLVFSLLATEILAASGMEDRPVDGLPKPDPQWSALLETARERDGASDVALIPYAMGGVFSYRVRHWMATAPLGDVLGWVAPEEAGFFQPRTQLWTPDQSSHVEWLVDRFTETYLEDWASGSLAMEWSYLHGRQVGCCPPDLMRERRTDSSEVARLLADLQAKDWSQRSGEPQDRQFSAHDFTLAAAENLSAGRQEAAAAIFAAVLSLSPGDTDANNNYGFCIMPTDTGRALHHLEKAAATVSDRAVEVTNAANRVLALHLLGRDEEACRLAEVALELPPTRVPSFLWRHGPEALKLTDLVDPRLHLEQLYAHLNSETRWDSCRCPAARDGTPTPLPG